MARAADAGLTGALPLGNGLGNEGLGILDRIGGNLATVVGAVTGSRPTEPDAVARTPCFADAAAPLASAADSGDVSPSLLGSFIAAFEESLLSGFIEGTDRERGRRRASLDR